MKKILFTLAAALTVICGCSQKSEPLKALIITGQNNHNWKVSHIAIKQILENSGLFTVDIAVSPPEKGDMSAFKPTFKDYKVIILDYNGDPWPDETNNAFLDYINSGGGLVVYHAADNTFRDWKEFNRIIGFGGWGNRDETDGPYIYMKDNQVFYDSTTPGPGGSHGRQHEFTLNCGDPSHPITKGLPPKWRHAQDELYDRMRGPGKVASALYWAHSPADNGTGRDEIPYCTIDYGKARIFHTTLGHAGASLEDNTAMQCTGFQVLLLRGAEWAATGKVTQPVPADFPTETAVTYRKNYKPEN
ncbi:MAG: ThuA domain-containing protein [Tannerella sp.]|jgi:type 1 glutamine amidotransferase|nr:ThuA domain-containing protein [Tannerella sp.]